MAEKLRIIIEADDETKEGVTSAKRGLEGLGTALGDIAKIAAGIIAQQLFTRVAQGIKDIAIAAVDAYADYQRLELTLQSLFAREMMIAGQADTVKEAMEPAGAAAALLLDKITLLALTSPFAEEDIAFLLRITMGYGMASDMAWDLTEALVEFAAGSGRTGEETRRLALALGQVAAKGYLAGEEMRQLVNAGIDQTTVARAAGLAEEDVAEAMANKAIRARELIPALTDVLKTDFGGAAERMSESWAGFGGVVATMTRVALRTLFGPTLEELQPLIVEWIGRLKDPEFRASLAGIGEKIVVITEVAYKFSKAILWVIENWNSITAVWNKSREYTLNPLSIVLAALSDTLKLFGVDWQTEWAQAKDYLTGTIWDDGLKPFFTITVPDALVVLGESVLKPFDYVWVGITGFFERIKEFVSRVFVDFHIPTPHFSINWQEVMGIRVPSGVSVSWYGSGLDAIFDRPTLIGVGERGAERVQVTPLGGGGGGGGERGDTWNINIYPRQSEVRELDNLLTMLQMARS